MGHESMLKSMLTHSSAEQLGLIKQPHVRLGVHPLQPDIKLFVLHISIATTGVFLGPRKHIWLVQGSGGESVCSGPLAEEERMSFGMRTLQDDEKMFPHAGDFWGFNTGHFQMFALQLSPRSTCCTAELG